MIGKGLTDGYLTEEDIFSLTEKAFQEIDVTNKKVLFLIPDHTRTAPLDIFFRALYGTISGRVKNLDFIVALGTHPPLKMEKILNLVGITEEEHKEKYSKVMDQLIKNVRPCLWEGDECMYIKGNRHGKTIERIIRFSYGQDNETNVLITTCIERRVCNCSQINYCFNLSHYINLCYYIVKIINKEWY